MAEIVMPRLSDSMEEGTVLRWLKGVGDEVAVGDELVEIETDKANMVYESDLAGTVVEVLAQEGDTLPVGDPIARVGDASEVVSGNGGGAGATPGGNSVSLTWSANSESDLAGYNVYRSTTSPVALVAPLNGATALVNPAYLDSTAQSGTTYFYVVTAIDAGGNSSTASAEVSATPSAPAPPAQACLSFVA
jgi:pyruvate dehydrogenase E2 component (dihydrolipoamide acetyltransferase)